MEATYEGFSNWDTWHAYLCLSNDEMWDTYAAIARNCIEDSEGDMEAATNALTEEIFFSFMARLPKSDELHRSIMNSTARMKIDWPEIATKVIEYVDAVDEQQDVQMLVDYVDLTLSGRLVVTNGARGALVRANTTPKKLLARHQSGDWGDLPEEDIEVNRRAERNGRGMIFSNYPLPTGQRVYVITSGNPRLTTILLPEEY